MVSCKYGCDLLAETYCTGLAIQRDRSGYVSFECNVVVIQGTYPLNYPEGCIELS